MKRRLALYGKPGVGKSTLARLLVKELASRDVPARTVKLAAPLYELQAVVYAVAGRPMPDPWRQDGKLLADLGTHLRRINPESLTAMFTSRVTQAEQQSPEAVLLCDDLRAPDVAAVTGLGFSIVEVSAPTEVRRVRAAGRGDLSPGDDDHPIEARVDREPWWKIVNDGTRENLRQAASRLADEVLR